MSKVYNDFEKLTSSLAEFFIKISNNITRPQAYNLAYILIGSNNSNSIITSDVASSFKGILSENRPESNERRIRRFLNNKNFDINKFFDDLIAQIISRYKVCHKDNNVFISLDHSFKKDDYVSLVATLKIGKQGIPIYFRTFNKNDKEAFSSKVIKDAIKKIHELFPNYNKIILADRWFDDPKILEYMDSLGCKFCFRLKSYKTVSLDNENFISLHKIKPCKFHSKLFENILFTKTKKLKTNLAIAPSNNTSDPWFIITNLDPRRALKYYSYRFGGIESLFRNQKSNGYNLEKTNTPTLKVFKMLFGITCVNVLWMMILGSDYIKNKSRTKIKLYDSKVINGKRKRFKSLFKIGKELFKYAYYSCQKIKIKTDFILYDQ